MLGMAWARNPGMEVVIQSFESRQYLGHHGGWVSTRAAARVFSDSIQAIGFCIQRSIRTVRLVAGKAGEPESYFYPFGGDPVVKAERKKIRRRIRESRRLKRERRMIQSRIDVLLSSQKELKKQFPFSQKR